jgi:hypothetical protein
MGTETSQLADNVAPPVQGKVFTTVVAGPQGVDLQLAANAPPGLLGVAEKRYWSGVYVSLQADGGDIYFAFAASGAVPIQAAGGAFATNCVKIPSGTQMDLLIPTAPTTGGGPYRFLMLTGAGTLRMWVSSPAGVL